MFQKWIEKATVLGEEKTIEVRKDSFWKRRVRIMARVGLEITSIENFDEVINKPCVFCTPEKLAKFDEKIFGEKMLENEYAFLFPNINPYAAHSAVCAFKKHYIKPSDFNATMIENNLELCMKYLEKVREMDEKAKYFSINWNYMMPAGASILHPHMQVVASEHPTTYMEKVMEDKNAFKEYVHEEIKSERFVGSINNIEIFTPFAPFGFNEVVGVVEGSLKDNISNIASVLEKIISYYASIGRNSFNIAIYSSFDDSIPLHFRCITRQNMVKYYRNDCMFFEKLHEEVILEKKPEEVAMELREFLKMENNKTL